MKKLTALLVFSMILSASSTHAFWMWSPKTKKFYNPKYSTQKPPVQQFNDAMKLYDEGLYESAFDEFRKLYKSYPDVKEAAEAQYYAGRCQEELGKYFQAFESYQVVIDKYPFSQRAGEIIERQYELGKKYTDYLKTTNQFVAVFQGSTDKVVQIYKTVIKNAPYGDFAAPAQFKIGEYLWDRGWYDEAREAFEKTIDTYPDSNWAKQARYQLALTDKKRSTEYSYDAKTGQEAIKQFEQVIELDPDKTDEARENISELQSSEAQHLYEAAVFYEKQKNYKAARLYYQKVVNNFAQTPWSDQAVKRMNNLPTL